MSNHNNNYNITNTNNNKSSVLAGDPHPGCVNVPATITGSDSDDPSESGTSTAAGALRNFTRLALRSVSPEIGKLIIGAIPRPRPRLERAPPVLVAVAAPVVPVLLPQSQSQAPAHWQSQAQAQSQAKTGSLLVAVDDNKLKKPVPTGGSSSAISTTTTTTTTTSSDGLKSGAFRMVKASVLGIVLFNAYDRLHVGTTGILISTFNVVEQLTPSSPSVLSAAAGISGLVAGGVHGFMSCIIDNVRARWANLKFRLAWPPSVSTVDPTCAKIALSRNIVGISLAHAFTHMSLFGGYEITKAMGNHLWELSSTFGERDIYVNIVSNLRSSGWSYSEVQLIRDAVVISWAGFIAGICSEMAIHYSAPLQNLHLSIAHRLSNVLDSVKEKRALIRNLPKPPVRVVAVNSLSSAFGFFAYEFGKRVQPISEPDTDKNPD